MAGADPERITRLEARIATEAQSAKWMTVALAGVGALLLAAIQLANLGRLEGAEQIIPAAAGGIVAAVGVVIAIVVTVGAMLPASLTLEDIREVEAGERGDSRLLTWLNQNRAALLRTPTDTVVQLSSDYASALAAQRTAFDAYYDDLGSEEKKQRAFDSGQWVLFLNGLIAELAAEAKLHQTMRAVARSRLVVALLSVLVAAGVVTLILATSAPEEPAVDLRGGDLSGVTLGDVELRGVNLGGLTIKNADLTGADLRDAEIEGTKWVNTVCPDGVGSNNAGDTCAGHLKP
jgi:Pentapeptide repeats (8 copies)